MNPTTCAALLDELSKIAAARTRMTVPQSRKGRRPMRVDTMLRKEKDGSLFKQAYDDWSALLPPARPKGKRKLQFPDSDEIGTSPRTETRQTSMGTTALAPRIGED
jgi:hypothetical protein